MHITELRLADVAPDLALLLDESNGTVDEVTYEATPDGSDLVVVASIDDKTRTFRLRVREED